MLSKHQLLHLNAILKDCREALDGPTIQKELLAYNKKVIVEKVDDYFYQCIHDANDIIKSGVFPDFQRDCTIHDYIEKETKSNFKNVK